MEMTVEIVMEILKQRIQALSEEVSYLNSMQSSVIDICVKSGMIAGYENCLDCLKEVGKTITIPNEGEENGDNK